MKTKAIDYRREIHKYAETGWREIRTSAKIAEIITDIGGFEIKMGQEAVDITAIIEPIKLTEEERQTEMSRAITQGAKASFVEKTGGYPGVIATFDTGRLGKTTAFRFDIDALPYEEPQEDGHRPYKEGFASINACVHACGHDGHTAIGLGLAEAIAESKDKLNGKIKLIFQPAEETFSGAESIVKKGHLKDVDYVIAIHLAISAENKPLPSHSIACGCSDFLSDRQLDIYYEGKSAHPSGASQEGKNALLAACSAALNLHAIAPHEEGLFRINVGEIHAGVCVNTIAPNALLKIEYRGQNEAISSYGGKRVMTIIDAAAKMYDLKYRIVDYGEIPTAKSDAGIIDKIEQAANKVEWFHKIYREGCIGGTDDAAVMINAVQAHGGEGAYVGLGCKTADALHNPLFDFDEESLDAGVELCMNFLMNI